MCLPCNSLGKKGFTCTRRSYKQGALRQFSTNFHVFAWIVKKFHNLLQGFLGLILSGNILKCDSGLFLYIRLGAAFPTREPFTPVCVYHSLKKSGRSINYEQSA